LAERNEKTVPIICGPTGSGKTAAAMDLAREFPLEIISADSRQIIKYLDIGTAKPTAAEQETVKFHLIDIIEPGKRYSAYQFIDDASRAIESVIAIGRIPVVVGGTGLYLRALTEGVVEIAEDDTSIRKRLEEEMATLGQDKMYEKLKEIDPDEAGRIHPHNQVRLIRALEIYYLTGKPKSEIAASGPYRKSEHTFKYFCLTPPREALYSQINERVDQMLSAGLVQEVQTLVSRGLKKRLQVANVIGYSEIIDHLDGNLSLDATVSSIKQSSRRYAKRQLTWFRKHVPGNCFESREALVGAAKDHCLLWPN
jgi:tRNA dimethylallyltransferase